MDKCESRFMYSHCMQGPRAEAMMRSAMERGKWVFFQNCHLAPSFMPALERLIEQIDPDKVQCCDSISLN